MSDSKTRTFIVLRGVPGCGKSEFAEMLTTMYGVEARIFTTDDYWNKDRPFNYGLLGQAHEWNFCRAGAAFEEGVPLVILANTCTQEYEFEKYVELAKLDGYRVYSLVVENRHGGTNDQRPPEKRVPEEIVLGMENRFELKLFKDNKVLRPLNLWGRLKKKVKRSALWAATAATIRDYSKPTKE